MFTLPVYLDHNATTPCDPRVVEAMTPYFTEMFGNAASRHHRFGWQAEEAVNIARLQLATLIGADSTEIVFTSGATEAVNLALKGVFEMYAGKGNHIITVATEHRAVIDTCRHLEKLGAELSFLGVNNQGLINLDELEAAIRPNTVLIAVMYANNETGVVQPVREIGQIAHKHGILFFTDATQAIGKVPVNVLADEIDLAACSAHKIYGPKGVGALYVRRKHPRVKLTAQMDGGGHERGMRSGTLNVTGIVGFGRAGELCMHEMQVESNRLAILRDKLEKAVMGLEGTQVNGSVKHRLPHVSNISFNYTDSEALMTAVNKYIAVSSGSACTSASPEPSHVLMAMGLNEEQAHSSIRFALGRSTTEEQMDFCIKEVSKAVLQLRETSPLWESFKTEQMRH
jgi:cysteine desulfurase